MCSIRGIYDYNKGKKYEKNTTNAPSGSVYNKWFWSRCSG